MEWDTNHGNSNNNSNNHNKYACDRHWTWGFSTEWMFSQTLYCHGEMWLIRKWNMSVYLLHGIEHNLWFVRCNSSNYEHLQHKFTHICRFQLFKHRSAEVVVVVEGKMLHLYCNNIRRMHWPNQMFTINLYLISNCCVETVFLLRMQLYSSIEWKFQKIYVLWLVIGRSIIMNV